MTSAQRAFLFDLSPFLCVDTLTRQQYMIGAILTGKGLFTEGMCYLFCLFVTDFHKVNIELKPPEPKSCS